METKEKAKEILLYCIEYLGNGEIPNNIEGNQLYKEMLREISFMIDGD